MKDHKLLCLISILLTSYEELGMENRLISLFLPTIAFEII